MPVVVVAETDVATVALVVCFVAQGALGVAHARR